MPYSEIRPGRIRLEDETTGSVRYIVQKDDNLEYLDANQNRIQRLSNIVFGNEADLPSAGIKGRIYVATDTKKVFFDDGTSWTEISGATAPAFHGCKAKKTADQSITAGSSVTVSFDTEVFDTDNEYDPSTNTFTPASAGYYEFHVSLNLYNGNTSAAAWKLGLSVNGTTTWYTKGTVPASTAWNHIDMQVILNLAAGDDVLVKCYSDSDVKIDVIDEDCYFEVKRLSA